jgi:hypothetical protein
VDSASCNIVLDDRLIRSRHPTSTKRAPQRKNAITKRGYRDRDSAGKSGGRIRPFFAFMRSARQLHERREE